MKILSEPADISSIAFDINASGTVVGDRRKPGWRSSHAFIWSATEGMRDVELPSYFSIAYAINDLGQVVGATNDPDDNVMHVFLREADGSVKDLGILDGFYDMRPMAISNRGEIGGYAEGLVPGSKETRTTLFKWKEGKLSDIGWFNDHILYDLSMNNEGVIVGCAVPNKEPPRRFYHEFIHKKRHVNRAFIYREGRLNYLNDLLPRGSIWENLHDAHDINDRGQIVGRGTVKGLGHRGFLLTPIEDQETKPIR